MWPGGNRAPDPGRPWRAAGRLLSPRAKWEEQRSHTTCVFRGSKAIYCVKNRSQSLIEEGDLAETTTVIPGKDSDGTADTTVHGEEELDSEYILEVELITSLRMSGSVPTY